MGQAKYISYWFRKRTSAEDAVATRGVWDAVARMACLHLASPSSFAAAWRVRENQADGAQQGHRRRHGFSGAAASEVLETGALSCARGARACSPSQWQCPGGALFFFAIHALRCRLTQENWQLLSSVCQRLPGHCTSSSITDEKPETGIISKTRQFPFNISHIFEQRIKSCVCCETAAELPSTGLHLDASGLC